MKQITRRPALIWTIALIALVFGLLTIKSGGQVLFAGEQYQTAAGNYIPFVVWFNFLAGFLYVVAGVGIAIRRRWAVYLSGFIVVATIVVFAIFGLQVLGGAKYEIRTVAAMSLRTLVWLAVFIVAYRVVISQGASR